MRSMKFYKLSNGVTKTETIAINNNGLSHASTSPTAAKAAERMAVRGYFPRAQFERMHPAIKAARQATRKAGGR